MSISLIRNDSETDIDRIYRDAVFFTTLMEQNQEMEHFVNESLIKASGNKRAINEMYIINEAAGGDKIKGFFEKIKNFFKKIFDKLGASLNAFFKEQKKYIEQYQYIITKCKWQVGDVSDIYDHFKGLPNIIDVVDKGEPAILGSNMDKYFKGEKVNGNEDIFIDLNTFKDAATITAKLNELKSKPVNLDEERKKAFEEFIKTGYWSQLTDFANFKQNDSNGVPSMGDTFKAWFNGSVDTVTFSGDEIENNFQTIINTCYAGESYLKKLEQIVTTVNKKMDAAAKMMEDYHKAQKDKILTIAKQDAKPTQEKLGEGVKIKKSLLTDGKTVVKDKNGKNFEVTGSIDEQIDKLKAAGFEIIDDTQQPPPNPPNPNKTEKKLKVIKNNDSNIAGSYEIEGESSYKSTDGETKQAFEDRVKKDYESKHPNEEVNFTESASYLYSHRYNLQRYFNEVNFGNGSGSNGEQKGQTLTGAGSTQVNNAGTTNTNISNAQTNKMDAKDASGVATGVGKEAEELLNLDIKNRETIVNANVQISTSIATAAFNAFKLTNKDFFDIIKAHVQWYLSNPGAEKNSENNTTRTRNLDMNAGGTTPKVNTQQPTPPPNGGGGAT